MPIWKRGDATRIFEMCFRSSAIETDIKCQRQWLVENLKWSPTMIFSLRNWGINAVRSLISVFRTISLSALYRAGEPFFVEKLFLWSFVSRMKSRGENICQLNNPVRRTFEILSRLKCQTGPQIQCHQVQRGWKFVGTGGFEMYTALYILDTYCCC